MKPEPPPPLDMDTDISQLEAPTFTTLADRGPSQAMLNLQWHHTANLIGKKVSSRRRTFWDKALESHE